MPSDPTPPSITLPELPEMITTLSSIRDQLSRFMLGYQFGIQEMETKVKILQQEFQLLHRYNPIEHVASRLKTAQSVLRKANRKGCAPGSDNIRREIKDIAGLRVVCRFTSDVYRVQEMLCQQSDVTLVRLKDYIAEPKTSGYRSLHAIVEIPVFLSNEVIQVPVEMQFRTIAQDFWASLEHKIFYKYDQSIPTELSASLRDAADTAAHLDAEMERLSGEVKALKGADTAEGPTRFSDETLEAFRELLRTAPA
ncbi:MAG TPA: GTP pyrophosphokinase family protein [Propionibacteriaceae bacterium]|nr:GTP pyrophosphokinase family protein [Propionibacteriaceae bacterium]HQE30820.1 GTP pyrophosphokinase family protein [Propionibacteriaceae bacterium]